MRWFAHNILPTIIVVLFCAFFIVWEYDLFPAKVNNDARKEYYVINLDRSNNRFRDAKQQTDKFGISLQKFKATDGYNVILEDSKTGEMIKGEELVLKEKSLAIDREYKVFCDADDDEHEYIYSTYPIGAKKVYNYILSAGEIGLVCSSRKLWKKIVDEDEQIAVIFEDDIKLYDDFDKNIQNIFSHLPETWDLVYVDAILRPISENRKIGDNYLFRASTKMTVSHAHAYMINKRSAEILLNMHERVTALTLDQFFASLIKAGRINAFISRKKIAGVRGVPSELDRMGRISPNSALFQRLKKQ